MYAKPTCSPLVKFIVIAVIVLELVAIGFLAVQRAGAESAPSGTSQQEIDLAPAEPEAQDGQQQGDQQAEGAGEGENAEAPAAEAVTVTVTFGGDCTLGGDSSSTSGKAFNKLYKNEGAAYFLQNVADTFGADDLTVVNLEGALTESKDATRKNFAFKGPEEYASILGGSGVEAASIANNHSGDYGEDGRSDTIEALSANGVTAFGYDRITQVDVKGVKVAVVGANLASDSDGTAAQQLLDNIAKAKADGAQLVLAYVYWGVEKETTPQESDMRIARQAIDAGADAVVGTHPHVIQGYEVYQGRYIVYSLGNLSYGGNGNPDDKDCLLFQQTFTVTGNDVAKNEDVKFIPCTVAKNTFAPKVVDGEAADRVLDKLQSSTDKIAEMAASL